MMQDDRRDSEINGSFTELRDLLADFTTGELTEGQNARLQQLVASDEEAGQFYLQYMFLYGTIYQEYCDRHRIQLSSISPADTPEPLAEDSTSASNRSIFPLLEIENELLSLSGDACDLQNNKKTTDTGWGFWGHINFSFVPWGITIIAGILILNTVIILPIYWARNTSNHTWKVVARVKRTVDCQWEIGRHAFSVGTFLISGQELELKAGLAEIEFSSGTRVILQGPARFIISDPNAAQLIRGRLAVEVSPKSKGFRVKTPRLDVVDLGTEFGVVVEHDTEVHVFKGLVEVKSDSPRFSEKSLKLSGSEGIVCKNKTDQISRIPANPNLFLRNLDLIEGVTKDLHVINPSFEVPDIRTLSSFQPQHGDTPLMEVPGWSSSAMGFDGEPKLMMPYTTLQLSPYTSSDNPPCIIGPGATDGKQVVAMHQAWRTVANSGVYKQGACQIWLYQTLGIIRPFDLGKRLILNVDVGLREGYGVSGGTALASFAVNVSENQVGNFVGNPKALNNTSNRASMQTLVATLDITPKLIGRELFIALIVQDERDAVDAQYHFDKVRVTTEVIEKNSP